MRTASGFQRISASPATTSSSALSSNAEPRGVAAEIDRREHDIAALLRERFDPGRRRGNRMVPWDADDADDADDATVCVGGPPGFSRAMKLSLPVLLSVNDGYVDSA